MSHDDRTKLLIETYELAEECLKINYYGAKTTAETLLPLLQLSDSPRIVNVSSSMGQLEVINHFYHHLVWTLKPFNIEKERDLMKRTQIIILNLLGINDKVCFRSKSKLSEAVGPTWKYMVKNLF